MKTTIEYKENNVIVGRMNEFPAESMDAAVLIAQKYMAQMKTIDAAHVFAGGFECVVSRATEWQKRNG